MADKVFPTDFAALAAVSGATTLLGDDGAVNGTLTVADIEAVVIATDSLVPAGGTLALTGILTIGDGVDALSLFMSSNEAYLNWNDGSLNVATTETDTSTTVKITGAGTGHGILQLYDADNNEYLDIYADGGQGYIETKGSSPSNLHLMYFGNNDLMVFNGVVEGKTPQVKIHGYRTGGSYKFLEIGVGIDADDTASFDGVSNYAFDGIIESEVGVATYSSSQALTAIECKGYVIYVTGAATITLPAVAAGMSVTIITIGAVAVSVDPNASDLIYLDGTALDDGDKITNTSTAGDIATLTYYSADGWYAATNGWSDGGA